MLRIFFSLLKKIVVSALFIYAYDLIVMPMDKIIPINFFNILMVSFFGVPAMIGLVLFSFII